MKEITLIGDVHGRVLSYQQMLYISEYSLQLGDFGFNYKSMTSSVDSRKHKFFPGNHDCYNTCFDSPYNLKSVSGNPNFGIAYLNGFKFFFVRGAFSIDYKCRTVGRDWFPEEELTYEQCRECLSLYKEERPDIVIAHDCPSSVAKIIGTDDILELYGYNPKTFCSRTQDLLEQMVKVHKPKYFYHGHHHKNYQLNLNNVLYNGIGIENYLKIYFEDNNGTA